MSSRGDVPWKFSTTFNSTLRWKWWHPGTFFFGNGIAAMAVDAQDPHHGPKRKQGRKIFVAFFFLTSFSIRSKVGCSIAPLLRYASMTRVSNPLNYSYILPKQTEARKFSQKSEQIFHAKGPSVTQRMHITIQALKFWQWWEQRPGELACSFGFLLTGESRFLWLRFWIQTPESHISCATAVIVSGYPGSVCQPI